MINVRGRRKEAWRWNEYVWMINEWKGRSPEEGGPKRQSWRKISNYLEQTLVNAPPTYLENWRALGTPNTHDTYVIIPKYLDLGHINKLSKCALFLRHIW